MVEISGRNPYPVLSHHPSSARTAGSIPLWGNNTHINNTTDITFTHNISASRSINRPTVSPTLGFAEILDIINPLHHLPIVGGIYREMTGDTISPVASIAGSALFGGPIGGVVAIVNAAIKEHSAQSVTEHIVSAFNNAGTSNHNITQTISWEDERMAGSHNFISSFS